MNCIEFRRQMGTDPNALDAAARAHAGECKTCEGFAAEMRGFEAKLLKAMQLDVPADLASSLTFKVHGERRRRTRLFALAASVFLIAGLAAGVWFNLRGGDLHDDIVAHVYHEPELLVRTDARSAAYELTPVLRRGKVSLKGDIGDVTHTRLCFFRGNLVAHLVVPGEHGPVTVLLLPRERVDQPRPIDEEGFRGTIFPVGEGSVAVVGMDDEPTEKIERRFAQAVEWTI